MTNELDKKILELFRFLISSGTKYLDHIDYIGKTLVYTVNSKVISLNPRKTLVGKEVAPNLYSTADNIAEGFLKPFLWVTLDSESGNTYETVYEIVLEGKCYRVPKLSRLEQAQTLDRIDATLKERELEILDTTLDMLTANSREEF